MGKTVIRILSDQVLARDLQEHGLDTVSEKANLFREISHFMQVNREMWISGKRDVHL